MQLTGLPEGTPILCRGCGAPAALDDAGVVRCKHCGTSEQLPSDALGRALEIKARLALARSRAAQATGIDAALAHIYEDRRAWLRVTGLYLAVALVSTAGGIAGGAEGVYRASAVGQGLEVLLVMAPGLFALPSLLLGGCFGVAVSLAYGRGIYRREVRPLLLATPPIYEGAPFACRACGGPLPVSRDVDIACAYCSTSNLVPAAWHGAHSTVLAAEANALRANNHGASARAITLASRLQMVFFVATGAWVSVCFVLPTLVIGLLSKLLYG